MNLAHAAVIAESKNFEERTYAKVIWRIIPLLFVCYVVAYLDRVNVGFAKLQMLQDLKFSETVFGLGAGMFFVGYCLFEVPTNLLLYRIGARKVMTRIMITWGIISCLTMFVTTSTEFYVIRFLLGVAEAGFFPGIILYLSQWFPAERRGRVTALFMTALPMSGVIGSPVSGWILQTFAGVNGWAGWQWLFLLEGIPTVLVGIVVWFYLDDKIESAKWLSPEEKRLLRDAIHRDNAQTPDHSFGQAVRSAKVWILGLMYFGVVTGLYGISFWLPTLIKASGVAGALDIGLLSAIPYVVATVSMILVGRSADRRRERRWHFMVPAVVGCIGLILSATFSHNTTFAIAALTLAAAGVISSLPLFWTFPPAFLGGAAAAGGIALIGALGNVGGFVSPYAVGFMKDLTHSTDGGMYLLAGCVFMSAIIALTTMPARVVNR